MSSRDRYRRDPDTRAADQATGCLFALLIVGMVLLIRGLIEALRYRPHVYTPITPDQPTEPVVIEGRQLTALALLGLGILMMVAVASGMHGDGGVALMVGSGVVGTVVVYSVRLMPHLKNSPTVAEPAFSLTRTPLTYTIYPARDKADFVIGSVLIRSLLQTAPKLTFQIVAQPGSILWQVVDPQDCYAPQTVLDHLGSHYPEATISSELPPLKPVGERLPFFRQQLFFRLANEYAAPLPFLDMLKVHDPLMTMTHRMSLLQRDNQEQISYSIVVRVASDLARQRAGERLKEGNIAPLTDGARVTDEDDNLHGLDERLLNAKLSEPFYHCFLVVTLESRVEARLTELAQIVSDLSQYRLARHNQLVLHQAAPPALIVSEDQAQWMTAETVILETSRQSDGHWRDMLLVLSPPEIAALWHLPNEDFTSPAIAWTGASVPTELLGEAKGRICLGETASPGARKSIYLALPDRAYHHYISGKTGTGKSTLMHNLIHQDIAGGRGVVVLDPHGRLIDGLLAQSIPQKRLKDVLLLECGDAAYPVPLNPFRIPEGISYERAFNYLYWVLRKMFESVWRERMDWVCRNVLHALLCDPEATPLDIERLFINRDYRETLIKQMGQHPNASTAVRSFWREFDHLSPSDKMQLVAPIRTRTAIFLGNRPLELMTCHPHTLNFQACIRERKIVLVKLSHEAVRSEITTLSALFLAGFYMASEGLGYIADGSAPRCYMYVDEAERILSSPLPEMFAHERKFGLSLTLANQYLDQLNDDTLKGVLGNVGTLILFESSELDARKLSRHFEPEFTPGDLVRLGVHRTLVKTRFKGRSLPPFMLQTHPPPQPLVSRDIQALRAYLSATNGWMSAGEVQSWLDHRYLGEQHKTEPPHTSKTPHGDGLGDYE